MREGKRCRGKLPLRQKKSTARNGCATKGQGCRFPGKGERDTKNVEARRYKNKKRRMEKALAKQVAVFLKSGPGDRTIRELHSDAEAIVVGQLLTINDLPEGSGGMQGSNAYHIAGLPGLLREYACAVRADVIGKGLLSIGRRAYQRREAHDDDDRQPPFDAASGAVVQRYLAQTLDWIILRCGGARIVLADVHPGLRDNRLSLARRWFRCMVPCWGTRSGNGRPRQLPHGGIG